MGSIRLPFAVDPAALLGDLEKQRCERSLTYFIRAAWHVIEPTRTYLEGWAIRMMAAHLEAITNGVEIEGRPYNRLLINVPPGMLKSLLTGVFWPAWEWGPRNRPDMRYLCVSNSQDNVVRDSMHMLRLVGSEWYQKHWGDRVMLTSDSKIKFATTATGFRHASPAGSIIGRRGDRVIIDDPHSFEGAKSDTLRAAAREWFLEGIPSRLNDPSKSAIIVIMQRLHEEDISGIILDGQMGYDHICLPMRYARWRDEIKTKLGYSDPRTEEGELLFEERFPEDDVATLERSLGEYGTAGQLQQDPVPRGGGIIKREWWQLWEEEMFPPFDYILAYLDTAYTEKEENDASALVIFGIFTSNTKAQITKTITRGGAIEKLERVYAEGSPNAMLVYAFSERLQFHKLVERVAKECRTWKVDKLMIENKAAGISVAQEIRRMYGDEDFSVQLDDPKGTDKVARLYSIQHIFQEQMVWAPSKPWAETLIIEVMSFPKASHDDQVDCVSGAIRHLRAIGLLTRAPERLAEIEAGRVYHKPQERLYPS